MESYSFSRVCLALSSLAKEGEICTGLTILGGIWAESALPSRATLHGTQSDLRLRLVLMATDWQASQQRHAGLVLSWGAARGHWLLFVDVLSVLLQYKIGSILVWRLHARCMVV